MKTYEVLVERSTSMYITVEAEGEEQAKLLAIGEAVGNYDFNNDPYPEYKVLESYEVKQ